MKKSAIIDIFNGKRGHIESIYRPKEHPKNDQELCDIYDNLKKN